MTHRPPLEQVSSSQAGTIPRIVHQCQLQRFNVLAHNVFASSRARHRKSRLAETEQSSALLSEGTFLEEAHVTVSETGRAIDVVVQAPEFLDRAQPGSVQMERVIDRGEHLKNEVIPFAKIPGSRKAKAAFASFVARPVLGCNDTDCDNVQQY